MTPVRSLLRGRRLGSSGMQSSVSRYSFAKFDVTAFFVFSHKSLHLLCNVGRTLLAMSLLGVVQAFEC